MPVKRLSVSFLSLFKSKLLENSKKSTKINFNMLSKLIILFLDLFKAYTFLCV